MTKDSPAVGAGVALPGQAPDRFLLDESEATKLVAAAAAPTKSTVIVEGYPAADAPLIRYEMSCARGRHESLQRTWLDPAEYGKHGLVIFVGDLRRANLRPDAYDREQLTQLDRYLRDGGALMLTRGTLTVFDTPEGREYLARLTGAKKTAAEPFEIRAPDHPWLNHLDPQRPPAWLNTVRAIPIQAANGAVILGGRDGRAALYQLRVGRGQLVYLGWQVSAGRASSPRDFAFEKEADYEQQMQILVNVIRSIVAAPNSKELGS